MGLISLINLLKGELKLGSCIREKAYLDYFDFVDMFASKFSRCYNFIDEYELGNHLVTVFDKAIETFDSSKGKLDVHIKSVLIKRSMTFVRDQFTLKVPLKVRKQLWIDYEEQIEQHGEEQAKQWLIREQNTLFILRSLDDMYRMIEDETYDPAYSSTNNLCTESFEKKIVEDVQLDELQQQIKEVITNSTSRRARIVQLLLLDGEKSEREFCREYGYNRVTLRSDKHIIAGMFDESIVKDFLYHQQQK